MVSCTGIILLFCYSEFKTVISEKYNTWQYLRERHKNPEDDWSNEYRDECRRVMQKLHINLKQMKQINWEKHEPEFKKLIAYILLSKGK